MTGHGTERRPGTGGGAAPRRPPLPQRCELAAVDFPFLTEALFRAVRDTAPRPVPEPTAECLLADLGYGPASLRALADAVARLLSMPRLPAEPVRALRFVADLVDLVDVLLADGSARPPVPDPPADPRGPNEDRRQPPSRPGRYHPCP